MIVACTFAPLVVLIALVIHTAKGPDQPPAVDLSNRVDRGVTCQIQVYVLGNLCISKGM